MADEFTLAFAMGGPAVAQARATDEHILSEQQQLQKKTEGRSNAVDDLLLAPTLPAAENDNGEAICLSPKKKIRTRIRAPAEPASQSSPVIPFDSTEFSLQGSYGVLPTPLAALSYSSSCPFLAESTEAKLEDPVSAITKSSEQGNKEKEAVEDDDDDDNDDDDRGHNKEKEVEREERDDGDDSDSEGEHAKAKRKAKAKKAKKSKKDKKSKAATAPIAVSEADEKERQVREIEDRMKRELARLEEQKERVRLELERLKSGGSGAALDDATAKSESGEPKERKAAKEKTKEKKKEKGEGVAKKNKKKEKNERRTESQQVVTRNGGKAGDDGDETERALGVLEDAQRVRLQTQAVISASAVVNTNTAKPKKKEKNEEPKPKEKKTKEKEGKEEKEEEESEEEIQSEPTVIRTRHGDNEKASSDGDAGDDEHDAKSESDDETHESAKTKKETRKAKKEEKEKEKKRKKEEKEREKIKRKEEKLKQRAERKARKAERKQRKKAAVGGLMGSIDSNASSGSNDQVQLCKESALWSEFVPFIMRESHSGLFASLATRDKRHRSKSRCDGDDSESDSSSESNSDSDTSSLSSSSSAASSDANNGGQRGTGPVPVELQQLMMGLHRFLTTVVCNAGFAGSDVFETTTGRLAGLGGLFAHPLGRNAFAVALKKLARQNTSFLLTEEGFQCILCLIEQVINAFDFKRYETDLSVARVIMNIASTFHRTLNGSTQFVQQFITAYTIWRDLMFWEKYFWDELAVAQRKGYESLDTNDGGDGEDDEKKDAEKAGEASADVAEADDKSQSNAGAQDESEDFVPFNPTLIFVLLHSTAYNMLNWDVDVRSVRKFVTRMCKKTCLSHDQRQSIMEIVDSFAKSLLAPAEGSFDTMQRTTSSGSSDDFSERKLGVRKKSLVGADRQTVDKKPEAVWNKEVLEHVIGELGRLTDEQQGLMAQKAKEREEEERRQEKERKKKAAAAAASKKGKGGKVEAGKLHLEKAIDTFQEVQLVQRSRVIEELVNTEKSYLNNLMMTVQHFLEPFRRAKVVSEGEINLLFSNIEIIVELSQTFLTRLEARLASWKADNRAPGEQFLSDIFALVFPFMKIYATYCGNFEDVNSYLQRNKNNEKLTRFIRQCETQTKNKLDLPSLLIMPVQRIPRYRLLLQELIKCTAPHHADYRKLCSALEMIKNIADFVNEQTKGSRLHTMQKNFGPKADSIVEPWRVWIKDGQLRALAIVEGAKVQIIPMYVILFNDLLVYAKSPKEYLGKVHLQEAWVKDEQDAGGEMQNILQFYSPSAAFLFAANSDEEKYEWIKALATNIDRQLQVDECREKRKEVLAEITKKKKKSKKQHHHHKEKKEESGGGGVKDESEQWEKQKKSGKKKGKAVNEDLLSAFLQFHPNVIPNTANELLTTTQRIEKTFRTLSRHFSFRNVKETPRSDGDKVKNDLDLATPPTLAFSERQLPTRAGRALVPPITPPTTPAPGAPLTAPARGRACSSSPSLSSSSPSPAQSPRKDTAETLSPSSSPASSSSKKSFWGLWSSSNHQVATAASPSKGKQASTPTPTSTAGSAGGTGGRDVEIFRL